MSDAIVALEQFYDKMGSNPLIHGYHERHGTESALILTVWNDERAALVTEYLQDRIAGKVVVEVGAGLGLLACHLATEARKVFAIEVDPNWASCFLATLYEKKPPNLCYIFGKAEEAPHIAADVAIFCTLSGRDSMYKAASRFAPVVIDVYAELMKNKPLWEEMESLTR